MPRPPRIQYPGACYHIYHRGNRREVIFHDEFDYAQFERFMMEAVARSNVLLYNWKLMPNHFHMLVQTPDGNIAEFMQRLLTRYAKYFNWKYHYVGHVFQGRYNAILVEKEAYFLELIRYIQLNAYRTKGQPLAKPGEWKWSSHRYFMMPESQWPNNLRTAFLEALGSFDNDLTKARRLYARFLADGLENGHWEDFYRLTDKYYLGSQPFIQKAKELTNTKAPTITPIPFRLADSQPFNEIVSKVSGISTDMLSGNNGNRQLSAWRQALVYVGRKYFQLKVNNLAKMIGREACSVSQILRRLEDNDIENHPEIDQLLKAIRE